MALVTNCLLIGTFSIWMFICLPDTAAAILPRAQYNDATDDVTSGPTEKRQLDSLGGGYIPPFSSVADRKSMDDVTSGPTEKRQLDSLGGGYIPPFSSLTDKKSMDDVASGPTEKRQLDTLGGGYIPLGLIGVGDVGIPQFFRILTGNIFTSDQLASALHFQDDDSSSSEESIELQ